MTEEELLDTEQKEYKESLTKLHTFSTTGKDPVHTLAGELAKEIDLEITRKRKPDQAFPNRKMYTEISNMALKFSEAHTTNKPLAETDVKRFIELSEKVPGTPSTAKKIAGIIGVVIIGLSIAAAVASFGGTSIFSAIGIAIGTTLLAKSLSFSAFAVGASVTAAGCGLFANGRRKGISNRMHNYLQTVEPPRPVVSK
jgi:hypothetical protein